MIRLNTRGLHQQQFTKPKTFEDFLIKMLNFNRNSKFWKNSET